MLNDPRFISLYFVCSDSLRFSRGSKTRSDIPMTNVMFELHSDDPTLIDYLEKIFEDSWAFIIGHTRKDDKIRVLAPIKEFRDIVQTAFKEADFETFKKLGSISCKIIPESEWLEQVVEK